MFHLKAGNSSKQQLVLSWKLTDPLPATTFDASPFSRGMFFCATIARTHTLILSDTSEVYGCGGNDKALSSEWMRWLQEVKGEELQEVKGWSKIVTKY